ncbi:hypothetical protein Dfulv_30820 [Dactylosporangium fulvum]|uniref:Transposase n=1 Tax=Dactylosporangium fulvum TaxID=53359 RepID=A0ABY5VP73_9ACTN|nr:hypothetical protein [Dactylosporangium fulvum]UWP79547.1 hypothetical protein Dfulv_30820 [Dactylosporangium fulvum]
MVRTRQQPSPADAIATELYGLPPQDFTATRNERARQARQAGDRDLAEAIGGLAKPNLAAWLVNQMAREYPQEIEALTELGASLRGATASLDAEQLRELSGQQHRVLYQLLQQARSLGRAAGHPVSDAVARGVEETLHAALADPDAAEQVRAGRLTGPLSSTGFPPGRDSAAATPRAGGAPSGAAATSRAGAESRPAQRVAAADRDLADAEAQVRDVVAERDRTQAALREAEAVADAVAGRVEALRRQLDEAGAEQAEDDRMVRAARSAAGRAERRLRQAEQRLRDTTERRRRVRTARRAGSASARRGR